MSSTGQSKGNDLNGIETSQLGSDLNDDENTLENQVAVRFMIFDPPETSQRPYHVRQGTQTRVTPQTGGYISKPHLATATQAVSNTFGGVTRPGHGVLPTPLPQSTLTTGYESSSETEPTTSNTNERVKSKVDNLELSIGLGISFSLFLMGVSTGDILYTILSGIIAMVAVAHYAD